MQALTFALEQFEFEGPLDLLLKLIQKNKIDILDLPIALLCDQYLAAIAGMQKADMDVASEFLVMASELMYIKSKMMLPKPEEEQEDPRADLTEMLLRYQQAKEAAGKMAARYATYSNSFVKDTDEIGVDKTFVADQTLTALCTAIRRLASYQESLSEARKATFTPMISRPIVPVELKIVGILHHLHVNRNASLHDLLDDSTSLPDMIAIFLGVLELIKMRKICIVDDEDALNSLHGASTRFTINEDATDQQEHPDTTISEEDAV